VNKIILVLLLVVGIINFIPVFGIISSLKISQAYSINMASNDINILMRHRALLFGIIGGFIFYSIYRPKFQPAAMLMAAISMSGFLLILYLEGGYNDALFKVAIVDICGLVCLLILVILKYLVLNNTNFNN
jgi:hypothetical protein